MFRALLVACLLLAAPWPGAAAVADDAPSAAALFRQQVGPLLKRKCAGCHGEGKTLEGELDLRTRAAMLRGGESKQPAVVPGKPDASPLYVAVTWQDEDLRMPPKERNRLTAAEVKLVRDWIAGGAPWPEAEPQPAATSPGWNAAEGVTVATTPGLSPEWTNRRYKEADLWAYRPIRRVEVPNEGLDAGQVNNPIDAFILRKLRQQHVAPAPSADRRTLVRRATIDLTGLPPTPQEVEAFVRDDAPDAYARLLARLLASEHYGEQQARHWLDVVRYADTSGFANDYERPNAWRYRDYVVRSFNRDTPFDRFIVEQLAGDELDPTDPEMLIAVGFLRMGPWEHTGMSVAAVTRQLFLDDVTHAVGVTFLGQALRCARCHDHKFDPLPTRDYYRLQAAFAPVQFADRQAPYLPEENISSFARTRPRSERLLKEANEVLAGLRQKHQRAVQALLRERGVKSVDQLPEKPQRHLGLTGLDLSLDKIYRKRQAYYERELKRYQPYAFSVYDGPSNGYTSVRAVFTVPDVQQRQGPPETVHVLLGGSLQAPGDEVAPGVLTAVHGSNAALEPSAWNTLPETIGGRRLALARWIASANNTLTARVIVNRIWQQHFGRGIVATPNNFGKMGGRPTHPDLLDWLATWFIDHGWSIKGLHQLIMSSATYQRASGGPAESKPELLAAFPPRRLTAEEIRDAMLAVSGELNPEMGGPGVYPQINWEVARQPRHIMGSVAPAYQPSPRPADRNRRTLYAFRYRTLPDPMLEVLNQPPSEISCERRDETTVTPQVFALFNGQFAHDRALALAHRLEQEAEGLPAQVELAFRLVYGRAPTAEEQPLCLAHVAKMTAHHRQHPPVRVELPQTVTRKMVEELTGEEFEWEEPLDLMAEYQEDLKPWDVGPETRGLAELCLVLLNSNEFVYVR